MAGRAFCSSQWIELMMQMIDSASASNPHQSSLIQQVCGGGGVSLRCGVHGEEGCGVHGEEGYQTNV